MLFIVPNIQANFGRKSKVHFDFFRPEYSGTSGGGPLISVGILPTEIRRSIFDNLVHCPTFLHLCRKFGKKIKMVRAIRLGWPGLIGKCRSIFFGYSLHWSPTGRLRIMKALKISLSQSDRSICTRPLDSTILPKPVKNAKRLLFLKQGFLTEAD